MPPPPAPAQPRRPGRGAGPGARPEADGALVGGLVFFLFKVQWGLGLELRVLEKDYSFRFRPQVRRRVIAVSLLLCDGFSLGPPLRVRCSGVWWRLGTTRSVSKTEEGHGMSVLKACRL